MLVETQVIYVGLSPAKTGSLRCLFRIVKEIQNINKVAFQHLIGIEQQVFDAFVFEWTGHDALQKLFIR